MKSVTYSFFLAAAIGVSSAVSPEWQEIAPAEGETTWFVAFEEASFIRKDIGSWLPIVLLETPEGAPLQWMLVSATRQSDQCRIQIRLTAGGEHGIERTFEWFDKGPDGDLQPELSHADGKVSAAFAESDGGTRCLLIQRSSGIPAIREQFSVSGRPDRVGLVRRRSRHPPTGQTPYVRHLAALKSLPEGRGRVRGRQCPGGAPRGQRSLHRPHRAPCRR